MNDIIKPAFSASEYWDMQNEIDALKGMIKTLTTEKQHLENIANNRLEQIKKLWEVIDAQGK